MIPSIDIPVTEASQVGEARRVAARLAGERGLDETVRGRIALIVTELGNNLVRHAQGGRLLIGWQGTRDAGRFEILSLDSGPGMADIEQCLRDGYSTGGTPGTGLGAVRRLADDFSAFSVPGNGSVILARVRPPADNPAASAGLPRPRFAWGGICLAVSGETVSGDAWALRVEDARASLIVADGLGHGPVAAQAADLAVQAFGQLGGTPRALLERLHPLMRATRGAAVAIAQLDADAGTLVFAGAGNIAGRLISGVEDRSLLSQHGTLGIQIRTLHDVAYAWPEHAMVVLHSDGLVTRWQLNQVGGLLRCDPSVIAGWLVREHTRGHDDVTVVVLKRG